MMAVRDARGFGSRWAGGVATFGERTDGDHPMVEVSHVYALGLIECGHDDHESHPDHGAVELMLQGTDGEPATVYLDEESALRLAFILQRAVGWIQDAYADMPDVEREAARWAVPS